MALSPEELKHAKRVSIEEGRVALAAGKFVVMRPEADLPEEQQYALIVEN